MDFFINSVFFIYLSSVYSFWPTYFWVIAHIYNSYFRVFICKYRHVSSHCLILFFIFLLIMVFVFFACIVFFFLLFSSLYKWHILEMLLNMLSFSEQYWLFLAVQENLYDWTQAPKYVSILQRSRGILFLLTSQVLLFTESMPPFMFTMVCFRS